MLPPLASGVMNPAWMAAIMVFILVEKAAQGGQWLGKAAGAALAFAGIWMALSQR
jgi:predicted metal-binding membrane protein